LISSRAIVSSGQYILKIQYFLICSETFCDTKGGNQKAVYQRTENTVAKKGQTNKIYTDI